ncbi:MAG: IS21 family transposase [Candidatus Sericytochromatia bacterium]|nr:IS21 family transposase [Candidatus Sericytochromatia bacterium]
MTKVELYELIRRRHIVQGQPIRAIARQFGIHRRVVRAALHDAVPEPRKKTERPSPVLGAFHHHIVAWLSVDRAEKKRKQHHTARRVWERLRDEHGCLAAESSVRGVVAALRRQLGLRLGAAFIPQIHMAGVEAEVDFYEADVVIGGERATFYHFCMRACHSGREFHMAFPRLTQQAFLEGHVAAFAHFGGVFETVRYDNLKPAVKKVLQGHRREETARFVALRSHYLFTAVFCKVGIAGAHEKGGVENAQGRFRRHHLVPIPSSGTLDSYNGHLSALCHMDDRRIMAGRHETVDSAWAREIPLLRPLPESPFATAIVTMGAVDQHGRIRVGANRYSVPIGLHGLDVEVHLAAKAVTAFHRGQLVAHHIRLTGRDGDSLQLDHYLEVLTHKPGGFAGSLALHQARQKGNWPAVYDQFLASLQARHGHADGTREMVEVLLLHRCHTKLAVVEAVTGALACGALDAAAVLHLLKYAGTLFSSPPPLHDLGDLERFQVPLPDLTAFDALLSQVAS